MLLKAKATFLLKGCPEDGKALLCVVLKTVSCPFSSQPQGFFMELVKTKQRKQKDKIKTNKTPQSAPILFLTCILAFLSTWTDAWLPLEAGYS